MTSVGTITVTVNGREESLANDVTVADLLAARGITTTLVAVERNGRVLRRTEFPETRIEAGDKLEIVHFVGGG